MILHITRAEYCGAHSLRLRFNDGTSKRVNVRPLLWGPVMKPLLDPVFFARVRLDHEAGTVFWPNGADFAPEALHDLPAEEGPKSSKARRLGIPVPRGRLPMAGESERVSIHPSKTRRTRKPAA